MEWFDNGWGLSLIVFLPLVGALVATAIPKANETAVKQLSLSVSLITFVLSLVAIARFDFGAAHSFQFVADDLSSGTYDVVACYDLTALAGVGGNDIDEDTAAYSKVVLGPRIITAQEVRATKTGIIDESGSNN